VEGRGGSGPPGFADGIAGRGGCGHKGDADKNGTDWLMGGVEWGIRAQLDQTATGSWAELSSSECAKSQGNWLRLSATSGYW
jgi:hypothetical protein